MLMAYFEPGLASLPMSVNIGWYIDMTTEPMRHGAIAEPTGKSPGDPHGKEKNEPSLLLKTK